MVVSTRAAGERLLPGALRVVVRTTAVPYGFTLTVWSTGAVVMHARGTPDVGDVFLFLAGALLAFVAAAGVAHLVSADAIDARGSDLIATGVLNVVVVAAAVGGAALVALIPTTADWLLGSFVSTAIFLAGGGAGLTLAHRRGRRRPPRAGA